MSESNIWGTALFVVAMFLSFVVGNLVGSVSAHKEIEIYRMVACSIIKDSGKTLPGWCEGAK